MIGSDRDTRSEVAIAWGMTHELLGKNTWRGCSACPIQGEGVCVWVESSQGNCSTPGGGSRKGKQLFYKHRENSLKWWMYEVHKFTQTADWTNENAKVIIAVEQERSKASSCLDATYSVPRAIMGSCQFLKEISLKFCLKIRNCISCDSLLCI